MGKRALILGGTKGLGLSLAWEAHRREILSTITGRSANDQKVIETFPPQSVAMALDFTDYKSADSFRLFESPDFYTSYDYIFWVAGAFLREPFMYISPPSIERMTWTHFMGPLIALRALHIRHAYILEHQHLSYHLITIASTSSWRTRENEAIYCALKAAKATFTRNFARELVRDLPGSKVTLVNPGGMKTPNFWKESGQDTSNFMNSDVVAKIIWDEVQNQQARFKELQIMRDEDGSPNLSYGPRIPELPFDEEV